MLPVNVLQQSMRISTGKKSFSFSSCQLYTASGFNFFRKDFNFSFLCLKKSLSKIESASLSNFIQSGNSGT